MLSTKDTKHVCPTSPLGIGANERDAQQMRQSLNRLAIRKQSHKPNSSESNMNLDGNLRFGHIFAASTLEENHHISPGLKPEVKYEIL